MRDSHGYRVVPVEAELAALRHEGVIAGDFRTLMRGDYLRTIPGVHQCDGFFAALIERCSRVSSTPVEQHS
jgi:16S rRNA (cytosine967-C5)-methyltransferase